LIYEFLCLEFFLIFKKVSTFVFVNEWFISGYSNLKFKEKTAECNLFIDESNSLPFIWFFRYIFFFHFFQHLSSMTFKKFFISISLTLESKEKKPEIFVKLLYFLSYTLTIWIATNVQHYWKIRALWRVKEKKGKIALNWSLQWTKYM
jgi:hypothetical protein